MNIINQKESSQDTQFDLEPWHEPVSPKELFIAILVCIDRFLILSPHQSISVVLWILHTHLIRQPGVPQVFTHSPILNIFSAVMSCGKSTLLETISYLAHRPLVAMDATSSALFHSIQRSRPTVLLDEFDNFDVSSKRTLLALLNSGYKQDGKTIRQGGKNFEETLEFSTWSAKLISGIGGDLPSTLQSRTISIKMDRKLPHQKVDSRNAVLKDDPDYFINLKRKIIRFVMDYELEIRNIDFTPPEDMNDRAQDNWIGLLKIAKCIDANVLSDAVKAAQLLSTNPDDKPPVVIELLRDIQPYIDKTNATHIPTTELLIYLNGLDESRWNTYSNSGIDRSLHAHHLAKLLKRLGIESVQVKHGNKAVRGYWDEELRNAIARYL